jgi:hypothetical protein
MGNIIYVDLVSNTSTTKRVKDVEHILQIPSAANTDVVLVVLYVLRMVPASRLFRPKQSQLWYLNLNPSME